MTHTNFQIFLKISLAVIVEIVDLTLRAIIDSFEIYIINSIIKKKLKLISLRPKLYLGVAQSKKNSIIIEGSSGSRKSCFQLNILF